MSAHTPGPWRWSEGHDALWGAETGPVHAGKTCAECGHCPTECGPSVLGVCTPGLAGDLDFLDDAETAWLPSDADARLIAAAPELLASLAKYVEFFSGRCINTDPEFQAMRAEALAVLAKAEGK